MIKVTLERLESSDQGTFGYLHLIKDDYLESFYSGELPWRDNKSNLSCIPIGSYQVSLVDWLTHNKKVYMLQDVKGRGGILIHSANYMGDIEKGYKSQLKGCIALGERLGKMEGQKALLVSSPAVRQFESLLEGKPFELEIK